MISPSTLFSSSKLTRVLVKASLVFTLASITTGCSHVQPWQRGKLAHHTMATSSFAGPAEEHVYSVQEGAVGGGAAAESGCGCN